MSYTRLIPIRRAIPAALVAGMLLSILPAATMAESDAPPAVIAAEWDVLKEVNRVRDNHGLAPLRMASDVQEVARERSRSMKRLDYFGHVSPSGKDAGDMLRYRGVGYRYWGEVIGWTRHMTLAEGSPWMVDWWKNSPVHRDLMLSRSFNYAGVGIAQDGSLTLWTIVFVNQADVTAPVAGLVAPNRSKGSDRSARTKRSTRSARTTTDDKDVVWIGKPAGAAKTTRVAATTRTATATRPAATMYAAADSPTTIRWWGRDRKLAMRTSGLHSFTLQHKLKGGRWHTVLASTKARTGSWKLRPGVHLFRVRARDNAGNVGEWQSPLKVVVG